MDKIIEDKWIPTPPSPDGIWGNKGRDHDYYQKIVSLAEKSGGLVQQRVV